MKIYFSFSEGDIFTFHRALCKNIMACNYYSTNERLQRDEGDEGNEGSTD